MSDEQYWLYIYKERHDWSNCPYAHRGERAARRCPRAFNYSAEPCPEYSKKGTCSQGETCPLAHSVFESWLHPSKFRTQLCCFGDSCHRRICFFAHNSAQLRAAAPSPIYPTGPVLRRTQTVVSVNTPAAQQMVTAAVAGTAEFASAPGLPSAPLQMPGDQLPASAESCAPGWVMAPSGWTAYSLPFTAAVPAGQDHTMALPSAQAAHSATAAVALGGIITAGSAADVSALAVGLQGLMLQQGPDLPILQQRAADQPAAAQTWAITGQSCVLYEPVVSMGASGAVQGRGELFGNYIAPLSNEGLSAPTAASVEYVNLNGAAGAPGQFYY